MDYQVKIGDYFVDKVGRVVRIKDIIDSLVYFDNNGVEQSLDIPTFCKILKDYGFRKVEQDEQGRINLKRLVESEVSIFAILDLLEKY